MSAKCPVFIVPAMDLDMYAHPSTQENLVKAEKFGHVIIPAEFGELASGLTGARKISRKQTILQKIEEFFIKSQPKTLEGKTGSYYRRLYL